MTEEVIAELLTHTDSLMNYMVWVEEDFGLQPHKEHHGIAIEHMDIIECKNQKGSSLQITSLKNVDAIP